MAKDTRKYGYTKTTKKKRSQKILLRRITVMFQRGLTAKEKI
jgi:hypothetical protein